MSDDQICEIMKPLFAKDCTFYLATAKNNRPSIRVVDTYYENGSFWIVTYGKSRKVDEILHNPRVALCNNFHRFSGRAYHADHPLQKENQAIRELLTDAFKPWYFLHNDESDEAMCYIRIELESGFCHDNGTGYEINFIEQTVKTSPFSPQIESLPVE